MGESRALNWNHGCAILGRWMRIARRATSAFTLDRLLDHVDADRMDILDTLIRVTLQEVDADLMHGILALRPWEHLVRTQLAAADGRPPVLASGHT